MKTQGFLKISVLKNSARPATFNFIKKRLQHKCFHVKLLRAPDSTEQVLWLLFKISNSNNLFKDVSAIALTHSQS